MRRLVLAGAGHAQLDLLASLRRDTPDGWQVTVVTSQPAFHYSGLLPAIIAGAIPADEAQIPVAAIARAAGMMVHEARVTALDAGRRIVTLHTGDAIPYDLLSLDVGSVPAGLTVPGAAAHAYAMRPFRDALALMQRLDSVLNASAVSAQIPAVIVGAGAAGVEIAFAVRARILAAGRVPAVTLVDASIADGRPLAGFNDAVRSLAARALAKRGISLLAGQVIAVEAGAVRVQSAAGVQSLPSVATAWVTGPAAPSWLVASGLDCDERGYPLADDSLALTTDGTAFGGGDCVTLRHAPDTAKAGVYAVRMAPILAANVRSAMMGLPAAECYAPQANYLALLSTGDGSALLCWRSVALESRWAHHLKRWIDDSYLRRYRALAG